MHALRYMPHANVKQTGQWYCYPTHNLLIGISIPKKIKRSETRIHSSRMRTTRSLTESRSICWRGGGCACHACPLPCMSLPCMHPAMHAPLPCTLPCHTCPLPRMPPPPPCMPPPAMHAPPPEDRSTCNRYTGLKGKCHSPEMECVVQAAK